MTELSNMTFQIIFMIPAVMIGTVYLIMGYKMYKLMNGIMTAFFILQLLFEVGVYLWLSILIGALSAFLLIKLRKISLL